MEKKYAFELLKCIIIIIINFLIRLPSYFMTLRIILILRQNNIRLCVSACGHNFFQLFFLQINGTIRVCFLHQRVWTEVRFDNIFNTVASNKTDRKCKKI